MVKRVDVRTGEVSGDGLIGDSSVIVAQPLHKNFVKIPLVGEQLVCMWLPIGGTEHTTTQAFGWFWSSTFDISASQFQNTDRSHPTYVGGQKRYAKTFNLKTDAPPTIEHEEGEVSILGRFGAGLRLLKDSTHLYSDKASITFGDQTGKDFQLPIGIRSTKSRINQINFSADRVVFISDEVIVPGKLIIANKWKTDIDAVIDVVESIVKEMSKMANGTSPFTVTTPAGPGTTTVAPASSANFQQMLVKLQRMK